MKRLLNSSIIIFCVLAMMAPIGSATEPMTREERQAQRASRPAPTDPIQKLERLLGVFHVGELLGQPIPLWAGEVPEQERKALKEAVRRKYIPNEEIAKELLIQARVLKANPEFLASADRIFVLAAKKGAYDPDELERISKESANPVIKELARKLWVFSTAAGKPFSHLSQLGVPLPDISSFHGQPVVIVLWSTFEKRFHLQWPRMKGVIAELQAHQWEVAGINFDPYPDIAAQFIEEEGIEWKSIYPLEHPFRHSTDYGAISFPVFWLIDAEGKVLTTDAKPSEIERWIARAGS